ncbi:MAG TPA: IS5 family transposase [Psychrobacter sp.]|nr:IS5 family transposase [Psychrobacter sp.]
MGKSRGGMTTKLMAMVDALGNLVDFTLLKGQQHDMAGVKPLIKDKEFGALLADRAFDTDWLLLDLEERGSNAVIPPKRSRLKQRDFDKEMYKWRHLIENFFCKLKDFKKIAMRAEKTDESFAANIYLAATIIHSR